MAVRENNEWYWPGAAISEMARNRVFDEEFNKMSDGKSGKQRMVSVWQL